MKKTYHILTIYFCIMAIGLFWCNHFLHISYDSIHFGEKFLPFMFSLSLLVAFYGIKHKKILSIRTHSRPHYIFFFISLFPLLGLSLLSLIHYFSFNFSFFIMIIDVLLIGIAEEGMFRGILFGSLKEKVSPIRAIIISSFFFSSLHFLNIIGGVNLSTVLNQMLSTLIMGIFLACIYIETQNIIFPILFHSLWDYILLNNSINDFPITGIIILLVYILEIIISIRLLFKYKKRNICLKSFINN